VWIIEGQSMSASSLFVLVLVFAAVVAGVMTLFWYASRQSVRSRIQQLTRRVETASLDFNDEKIPEPDQQRDRFLEMFERSDDQPRETDSLIRKRLLHAGLYRSYMPNVFMASKIILSMFLCIGTFVLMGVLTDDVAATSVILLALIGATVGYLMPDVVLGRAIQRRQEHIRKGLPEAADFLVVCVEAGQALDSAFVRVAQEMRLSCPDLAREMHWVTLEFRAGRPRTQALQNMSDRTGVEDVEILTNMLNQADRFGTSTSDALRVYADMLRVKRRQQAQEKAAKIPVKLLFPLIFFIFPSLLVILAGPAMIQIFRVLMPSMASS
jgi:tight adherence protein C